MNPDQRDYILKHKSKKSVRQIAKDLNLDRQEVKDWLDQASKQERRVPAGSEILDSEKEKKTFFITLGVLIIFSFLMYVRSLSFPFLNFDDPKYISNNLLIQNLDGEKLKFIFTEPHFSMYIPLTLLSYAVDFMVYELNPFGYRLTGLLFHLLNTFLTYLLVMRVTRSRLAGFFVALFFGIHPLQIESVVWIAERKNVLSTCLFLTSFLSYIEYRQVDEEKDKYYLISFVVFMIACFAKPNVVVLPLLLIAYDVTHRYGKVEGVTKKWSYETERYLPFLLGSLMFAIITFVIVRDTGKMNYHGGSFYYTIITMTVVMMKYLGLLVLPLKQSLLYAFPAYQSLLEPAVILSCLGLILTGIGLSFLWRRDKKLCFWGGWYFILLLPMMNIVPFPSLMNDRYLYLPMIGFFSMIILLLKDRMGTKALIVFLCFMVILYSFLNIKRQSVWAQQELLWQETQGAVTDANWSAAVHNNLSLTYQEQKKYDLAHEEIKKALELRPNVAEYHNTYGTLLSLMGKNAEAEKEILRALEISPNFADALYNMGKLHFFKGNLKETASYWSKLIKLDPYYQESAEVKDFLQKYDKTS